jgi:hypothetical protein
VFVAQEVVDPPAKTLEIHRSSRNGRRDVLLRPCWFSSGVRFYVHLPHLSQPFTTAIIKYPPSSATATNRLTSAVEKMRAYLVSLASFSVKASCRFPRKRQRSHSVGAAISRMTARGLGAVL